MSSIEYMEKDLEDLEEALTIAKERGCNDFVEEWEKEKKVKEKILYDLNRFEAVKNILWSEDIITQGDKMKEIRKSIEVEDYYKHFIDRR